MIAKMSKWRKDTIVKFQGSEGKDCQTAKNMFSMLLGRKNKIEKKQKRKKGLSSFEG